MVTQGDAGCDTGGTELLRNGTGVAADSWESYRAQRLRPL